MSLSHTRTHAPTRPLIPSLSLRFFPKVHIFFSPHFFSLRIIRANIRESEREGEKNDMRGLEMSAGKPITEHGLRLRKKKNYYSCPSVNHAPPPGNVAKKERDRERKREEAERE